MGVETVTIQNLEIVKIDLDRNLLLIKGSIPGPRKGLVVVKRGVKTASIEPLDPSKFIEVKEEVAEVKEEVTEVKEEVTNQAEEAQE